MFVILGVRRVRLERADEYTKHMEEMTRLSLAEPGCVRYEFMRENDAPTLFILYEGFTDEAAARAHQNAPYHDKFREISKDWYIEPHRVGRWEATIIDFPAK